VGAPLPPATLSADQSAALQCMNEAGRTPFEGRTWHYELGSGCVLRVQRSQDGRSEGPRDLAMAHRQIEVITYVEGFGVKAYARGKGGSEDMFDSTSSAQVQAFADSANRLIAPCTTQP
jgi:hypothetical protein